MGTLSLLLGALTLLTRFKPGLTGLLLLASGAALFCDLGAWFLARETAALVIIIATSGTVWMVASTAQAVLALIEMWAPSSEPRRP